MPSDSVERFSNRVESYARYRPNYPAEVLRCLQENMGLTPGTVVADIGAGTGLLTERLLHNGNVVYAVEPNEGMRQAAAAALGQYANLHLVDGRSEATTLPPASVDLVTAAQAFHWFEPVATRAEFVRILRPPRWVALIWNDRRDDTTPFLVAYRRLLDSFNTDYRQVDHKYVADTPALQRFFAPGAYQLFAYPHNQVLDLAGLIGRLRSTSYIPAPGDPGYDGMVAQATELFDQYAEDGKVRIEYDTQVFLGQLDG
jgi:ubiquinone/menaquinone biosynthesis C-methylase UbiE